MTDEQAWVARAARGEGEAMDRLAQTHRPAACRLALALLGDRDAAEDVAQDVLVRLTAALPGFRGDAELSTWIYRVTLNLCRDHLRRKRRRAADVPLEAADDEPALSTVESPDAALDTARMRDHVRTAIGRLPEDQREAITLRYVAELSYREIARATGTPQGTVASRVFRALKRLGRDLEPRYLEMLK